MLCTMYYYQLCVCIRWNMFLSSTMEWWVYTQNLPDLWFQELNDIPSAIGPMTWFHYKLLKIVKFSASFWNCSATGGYWHAIYSEFHVSRKKKVYPSLYCICIQHWLLIVQLATKLLWVWTQMKKKQKRLEVHTFCHEGRLQLPSCA